MAVHAHRPWPSLVVSLLGIAVGSSYVTKAVGAIPKSDTDLLIGILCLVLGIGSLISVCQRWDRDRH
jgi:hypothetical protein